MNNQEDFVFWSLAKSLICEQGYRVVQLFENQKELWLEKLENKKAPILRMLRQDLDWSLSMQRDIEIAASNGEKIRKQIGRNELKILNVYVSPYPPVDEYEFRINLPYALPESPKTTVETILMSRQEYQSGFAHLSNVTGIPVLPSIEGNYLPEEVEMVKQNALDYAVKEINIEKALFNFGKPRFTYVFIFIQVAVFLFLEAMGGSTNSAVLIQYGAKFNPLILEGEWWRFITPIFIHIGFMHLAMNTLALYYLGTTVERIYGNTRFILIYLFAGICGSVASFIFSIHLSAGASGAIFGCFGSLLYFGTIYPKLFFRTMGKNVLAILIINLIFDFTASGIDNAAHLGGLAGGFLATGIVYFPKRKKPRLQILFFIFSAVILTASLYFGFHNSLLKY